MAKVLVRPFGDLDKCERVSSSQSVLQHFQHIQDPRVDRTKHHGLMEIMTIALFAVLSGADGFVARNLWQSAQQWLESLQLPYGIPSHDTFARRFALEPKEFKDSFLSWVSSITERDRTDSY